MKRMSQSVFGTMQKVLFGRMDMVEEASVNLRKKLERTSKMANVASSSSVPSAILEANDDYVLLRSFEIVERHPLVNDVIARQLSLLQRDLNGEVNEEEGGTAAAMDDREEATTRAAAEKMKKVKSFVSQVKHRMKSARADGADGTEFIAEDDEDRIKNFVVLTDSEPDTKHNDKTVLPNGELVFERIVAFMAVGDNESQQTRREIVKYKDELSKVKREFPYLKEDELQSKMAKYKIGHEIDLFFPFTMKVTARKTSANGPYRIEKMEMCSQDDDDTYLTLDQFIDEAYNVEFTEEEAEEAMEDDSSDHHHHRHRSQRYRPPQIIDAEVVEK